MRHRGVSPLAVWETGWKSGLITLELEVSVQVHLAPQEKASTLSDPSFSISASSLSLLAVSFPSCCSLSVPILLPRSLPPWHFLLFAPRCPVWSSSAVSGSTGEHESLPEAPPDLSTPSHSSGSDPSAFLTLCLLRSGTVPTLLPLCPQSLLCVASSRKTHTN